MYKNNQTALSSELPLKKRRIRSSSKPSYVPGPIEALSENTTLNCDLHKTRFPLHSNKQTSHIPLSFKVAPTKTVTKKRTSTSIKAKKYQKLNQFSPRKNGMWLSRYFELKQFQNKTGHCNVPQQYPSNIALGRWVHKQRQDFKKANGNFASEYMAKRFQALLDIGFEFETSNRAEALWHQRFKDLQEYKQIKGDCNVPQTYEPNKPLGKWVRRQRYEFMKMLDGESSTLTKHRIEALEAIGFKWAIRCRRKNKESTLMLLHG